MPFQSKAQMRKFGALVGRGEMSKDEFRKWLAETPAPKSLPERKKKAKVR